MTQALGLSPDIEGPADAHSGRLGKRAATLSDRILNAFHTACDKRDIEVAESLIGIFELSTRISQRQQDARQSGNSVSQRYLDSLVAAHERLWNLKQVS